jgi:glucose-6-phosphate isomerase
VKDMQADAWRELFDHAGDLGTTDLRSLFASDPDRGHRLVAKAAGLHLDYSKQRITDTTLGLLDDLAAATGVRRQLMSMDAGELVNGTEHQPALHTALRRPASDQLVVAGEDVVARVHDTLDRMAELASSMRAGTLTGATGRPLRNVVHVGIGGSVLGPAMVTSALGHLAPAGLTVRYVANIDPVALADALDGLDPAETLLLVVSKTFTTAETMANATEAMTWLTDAVGPGAIERQVVGVTSARERALSLGLRPDRVLDLPQWVGGRFSLSSAAGLSTMIAIGPEAFGEMLAGMHALDRHTLATPVRQNPAVLHGLLAAWNRSVLGASSVAMVPYASALSRFPAFLQQLAMESNGKSVTMTGTPVDLATGAVVWGEPGTDAQHSFFQLLHQGTTPVPVDFVVVARAARGPQHHQDMLVANALAQSAALAFGRTAAEERDAGTPPDLVPHRVLPGNRPSTTTMLADLSPASLGALIALHEHSVVTQAAAWGINAFDQWGVERGKVLAAHLVPLLSPGSDHGTDDGADTALDSSTASLVDQHRRWSGRSRPSGDAV